VTDVTTATGLTGAGTAIAGARGTPFGTAAPPGSADAWSAVGSGRRGTVGVVVVHGFTASPQGTRGLGERLAAAGFTTSVPRLPGHGTSLRDLARTRYRDWRAALEQEIEHLRVACERIVLVGHSLGGTLCLDVASRHPDRVDALAVINPQVLGRTELLARLAPLLKFLIPAVPRQLAGLPVNDVARPGAHEQASAWVPSKAAASLVAELPRLRRQLLDLEQPLLVLRSPQDHTVPPANALELVQLVGSADVRQVVCERSYHVVLLDEDHELAEDAVIAFVADVTGT
jgi:carboxylesterase